MNKQESDEFFKHCPEIVVEVIGDKRGGLTNHVVTNTEKMYAAFKARLAAESPTRGCRCEGND